MLSRASRTLLFTSFTTFGKRPTAAAAAICRPIMAPSSTPTANASSSTSSAPAPSSTTSSTAQPQPDPQPTQPTPVEDAIRAKIIAALSPTHLTVANDSHRHAHHAAMQADGYAGASETHFRVYVVSDQFVGKMQPARHRMVYRLLTDELAREGGIHALQLVTRTAEEEARRAVADT